MKLEEILKKQGRTKTWFASQMDVSLTTVVNWCKGRVEMSTRDIMAAKQILNLNQES